MLHVSLGGDVRIPAEKRPVVLVNRVAVNLSLTSLLTLVCVFVYLVEKNSQVLPLAVPGSLLVAVCLGKDPSGKIEANYHKAVHFRCLIVGLHYVRAHENPGSGSDGWRC